MHGHLLTFTSLSSVAANVYCFTTCFKISLADARTKRMTKTPREMPEESNDGSTSTSPSSPLSVEKGSPETVPGEITHAVMYKITICVCVCVCMLV